MTHTKRQNYVQLAADYEPEIGIAIWRLEDARERTLEVLTDLPQAALDWQAPQHPNTIGTLLYHIAAIEADWFYAEVLENSYPVDFNTLLPHDVRDNTGRLWAVSDLTLAEHLARLQNVRKRVLAGFQEMDLADYRRQREFEYYFVTPEWVLHHLAQHEAEHRGEILTIRGMYTANST